MKSSYNKSRRQYYIKNREELIKKQKDYATIKRVKSIWWRNIIERLIFNEEDYEYIEEMNPY